MDRSRRSRRESRADGLACARGPNNRAWRLTGRAAWDELLRAGTVAAMAAALAAATAGCSLSFPIAGFKPDATPTGTIDRSAVFLSPALDAEDLRRARAALSIALDPQGNGARVNWQNPQTGAHGAFASSAPPFTEHDRVCRAFAAEVASGAGAERHVAGSACREGDGSWILREAENGKA